MAGLTLSQAMAYARAHATEGLKTYPYDSNYLFTLDQLAIIDRHLAATGNLRGLAPGEIAVGMMAAKSLGNDEAEFANALGVIQWEADTVTGERKQFRR